MGIEGDESLFTCIDRRPCEGEIGAAKHCLLHLPYGNAGVAETIYSKTKLDLVTFMEQAGLLSPEPCQRQQTAQKCEEFGSPTNVTEMHFSTPIPQRQVPHVWSSDIGLSHSAGSAAFWKQPQVDSKEMSSRSHLKRRREQPLSSTFQSPAKGSVRLCPEILFSPGEQAASQLLALKHSRLVS